MNTQHEYRLIHIATTIILLLYWTQHWWGKTLPENADTAQWLIAGLFIMIVKTVPLLIFVVWLFRPSIKAISYLDFALIFYFLVSLMSLLGTRSPFALAQLVLISYALWHCVKVGRVAKKAFKAKQKSTQP
ncbi:hypothetical protein [Gynuella sp.]|uniref:hypothetical protein n=1 Tax=Gynuella sp. TaxID=2969146 RepID=UPI003D125BA4